MIEINPSQKALVIQKFTEETGAKSQGGGQRYKEGLCPQCQKRKLWIFGDNPWSIQCDSTECGYKISTKDKYPEIFKNYTERFAEEMKQDDRAIAKAYFLADRGLDIAQYNSFTQETFKDYNTQYSTPTIRFLMPKGGYWERFIEESKFKQKARFKPGYLYKGLAWNSAKFDLAKINELWIVEGIFDALALLHHDVFAISAMSANNFPGETLSEIYQSNPNLSIVLALDSDAKGKESALKWLDKVKEIGFRKVSIAITDDKDDWNDKHLKKSLYPSDLQKYFYYGLLLAAESAIEMAQLMQQHTGEHYFLFEFNGKTYCAKRDEKQAECDSSDPIEIFQSQYKVQEIANCTFAFLYGQKVLGSQEISYYVEIIKDKRRTITCLSGKALTSVNEFRASIVSSLIGASYTGDTNNLDSLYRLKTASTGEVTAIDFMGYFDDAQAYIYGNFAIYGGVIYKVNSYEYIELPNDRRVKTVFHLPDFNPSTTYRNDWWDDYLDVFGVKGVVVLAYWLGSLFAGQIRQKYQAYPFLELTGEPSSGKSMILRFLWALLGRHDYEGANPNLGTENNYLRTLAQVSNLPIVMIECEGFNLESLKAMYNGGILRATAKKDMTNETNTPKFRGALVISQNERVISQGSKLNQEALLSRLVYVHFDKTRHTPKRAIKARRLEQLTTDEVSGFLIAAITQERKIMETIESRFDANHQRIMDLNIEEGRIGLTHGLMLSLVEALPVLVPLSETTQQEVFKYIDQMAIERELELKQDHPALEKFWDAFDSMESQGLPVNHSSNPKEIAIQLSRFYSLAAIHRYQLDDIEQIKKLLPETRHHKFIEKNKERHSRFYKQDKDAKMPKTIRAYVFKRLNEE